jgi:hypothetical protein
MTDIAMVRAVMVRAIGDALRAVQELTENEERRSWADRFLTGRERGAQGDELQTLTQLGLAAATALEIVRRQGEQIEELERRVRQLEEDREAA